MTKPTTLYRLYDDSDSLLYVGVAGNPGRRFDQHAAEKDWWTGVARAELEHFPTRAAALVAESAAILAESPKHNGDRIERSTVKINIALPPELHRKVKALAAERGQTIKEFFVEAVTEMVRDAERRREIMERRAS